MNTPKSKKLQLVPIIFCCVEKDGDGRRHAKAVNSNEDASLLESKLRIVLMIVRGFDTYILIPIAFIWKGTRQLSDAATARICCSHGTPLPCSLIATQYY